MVSPVTVQDNAPAVHVQVLPPGLAVTTYLVIADPPLFDGAVHDTTTCPLPRTPVTLLGRLGYRPGVTDGAATEGSESPTAFVAVTVKVYAVPLVNEATVHNSGPEVH